MTQLQKYTWLIDTIRRAGKISLKDLSDRFERNKDLSDYRPLTRCTFTRWRRDIEDQFGIRIVCQAAGGYLYYIENPEDIDDDRLKKWMLDSMAVGNLISQNLALKDRILVDSIPSGRHFLTPVIEAMQQGEVVDIVYSSFRRAGAYSVRLAPYCVKLFENRWYVLGPGYPDKDLRIYGLDRIKSVKNTGITFRLPKKFDASGYFDRYFGIVADSDVAPEHIIVRAETTHARYLRSLPLHHSQRIVDECGTHTDFELYLAPTYDFIMKLLQAGPLIEVLRPAALRNTMRQWIAKMYKMYKQ